MSHRPSLPRIAATMAIALAVSAVAVIAGFWQHGRHVERADARAAYDDAVQAPATDLGAVAPADADGLPDGAEWRTVTATGTFDRDSLTVLRGRPVESIASWQYLAWLDTNQETSVLVSLGWIPQPGPLEDPQMPELDPDQVVTVTGVLRAWEDDDGREPTASITRIAPEQLPAPAHDAVPGYVMSREVCDSEGCRPTVVGSPVPLPELTLGPHLSYAWQWWLFAVLAPVGGVLLLRRDARMAADDQGETPTEAAPASAGPRRPRRRRGPTDEEIEDSL